MAERFPEICDLGLTGVVVRFADRLSEPANRAALALARAVDRDGWPGVEETATALASAYVRYDPVVLDREALFARLGALLEGKDWYAAGLPPGRRRWTIPLALGGAAGPQLAEAAELAGLGPDVAVASILQSPVRVLALGFAPGQPYMGKLPEAWAIPRQDRLTPEVPAGAVVVAIRQIIIFAGPAPTGWRQIGRTGFRPFWPDARDPIRFAAGDEVRFTATDDIDPGPDGLGGATVEDIP